MLVQRTELGIYTAGEQSTTLTERRVKLDGTRPAVICCHGRGANSTMFAGISYWPLGLHAADLAQRGFIVMSIDAGGTVPWSNQTAMDSLTAAYNWLMDGRAAGGRVGLVGWSMGGLTVLNWLKRNPAKVSQVVAWAPAVNLAWHHDSTSAAAEIEAAFGGAAWLANSAPFDPLRDAASYSGLDVPVRIWHSTDDVSALFSHTEDFVEAADNPKFELTPIVGHGHQPFYGVPVNTLPSMFDVADWD